MTCDEDGGNFSFSGCNRTCVAGSGNPTPGYSIGGDADAVTVSGLGDVSCASSFNGEASVTCASDSTDLVPDFVFDGCEENECTRLTDVDIAVATQYVFVNETAATEMTLASALGDVVTCAANHQGEAEVRCAEDGGDFELSGCSRNVCVSGSGNRSGYDLSLIHI